MKASIYPFGSNFLKPLLIVTTCFSAMLLQSTVFAQTDQAADDADDAYDEMILEEVVVTGIRRSLDFAAGVKRESNSIVDALMAQDIGLFSDNNIGEALARIPGVLLERDAGEGFRISIRGLGPRFVRTTINGRTALSPAGGEYSGGDDARGFTYNIMPSEVISKVRVLKSTQARDLEGGIGGVVDLETNRPVDFAENREQDFYISGTLRATYNDLLEETAPRVTVFVNKKFGDNWGAYFGATWDDQNRIDNLSESQNLRIRNHDLEAGTYLNGVLLTEDADRAPYSIFSGVRYQEQEIFRERQTYITGVQWKEGNWDVNFDWTYGTEDETRDDKRYWTNPEQISRSDEDNLTSVWIDFDDAAPDQANPTDGTQTAFTWDGAFRNNTAAPLYRLLPRESEVHVGGINAQWSDDIWIISGDIGYASQDNVRVLERLRSRLDRDLPRFADGTSGSFDISSGYPIVLAYDSFGEFIDPLDPSHQYLDLLERSVTHEQAEDTSARLDFNVALGSRNDGDLISLVDSIDFGVSWNEMQFQRDLYRKRANEDDFDLSLVDSIIVNDLLPGVNVPGFVHDFAIFDIRDPQFDVFLDDPLGYELDQGNTFDVTEETTAAYVQFNFMGEGRIPYRGNVGVRYVSTDQTNVGWVGVGDGDDFVPADPDNPMVTTARTYSDWLPSFNMALDFTEEWVMRFAANKAFTRPDPIDMSSRLDLNDLDEDGDLSGSGGNPHLVPYITYSYETSLEFYPDFGGSYGLGVFYKDLTGYIANGSSPELVTVDGEELIYDIRRPINTDGGTILGVEFQFHTPLDFLPGFLQYFGINGSYTWVDAEMDAVVPDRDVPITLRGTSEKSGNLVLYFEKSKFGARLAAEYRSAFLHQEARDNTRFDEFTNGRTYLDLNLDYIIGKRMKIRFTANNLTNEQRTRYWATPGRYYSDERDNGRTYVLELRISNK
jgi:TonB-dependent receptor